MKFQVTLNPEKATPNTVKFNEPIDEADFLATRVLGNLYVPKSTLAGKGYQGGKVRVTIEEVA